MLLSSAHSLRPLGMIGVVTMALLLMVTFVPIGIQPSVVQAADDMAKLRAVHAVPDIAGSLVDVYVGQAPFTIGEEAVSFDFFDSTSYLDVPAGVPLDVRVVLPSGGDPNDPSQAVISTSVTLDAGQAYSAVARGTASMTDTFDLGATALGDDTTAPPRGAAKIRVAHFSPGAPAVDIFVNGERSTLTNLEYLQTSGYLTVPAGSYTFGVAPTGNDPIFTTDPLDLQAGQIVTAWAVGLLNGSGEQAFAVQPTVDAEYFYLRGVHTVPDIAGTPVDVYINDGKVATFDFFDATGYLPLPSGVDITAQVVPAGGDPGSAVISQTLTAATFSVGDEYSLVARGTASMTDTTDLGATILTDDNTAPVSDTAKIRVAHFSPDAPAVDIFVNGVRSAITDLAYDTTSGYVELDAGSYEFGVAPADGDPIYTTTVTLEAGTVVTAWANGLLNGTGLQAFKVTPTVDRDYNLQLRVLHASPNAPPVDVLVNGTPAVTDLAFGSLTSYLPLTEGLYTIAIRVSGTETIVLTTSLFVEGGKQLTVAAIGLVEAQLADTDTSFMLKVLEDDTTRPEGTKAKIRLVHLVPDAPAVDLRVGETVLFDDVAYPMVTEYIEVDAGVVEATVTNTDGTQTFLEASVVLAPSSINTVYAIGQATPGGQPLRALVATDLAAVSVWHLPIIFR